MCNAITCDDAGNCAARIPLKQNTTLSWSIQAEGTADQRKFNSYAVSGEYPGCEENNIVSTTASAATSVKQPTVTENKNKAASELVVYPNPATGELIIKWSSEYMGNAKLIIADAPGKASKQFDLNKQLADQLDRISVTTLSSGLYFLQIKNGGWQIAQHTLCKEVKYIMLRKKAAFKKDGLFKFCAKVEEEPLVICLLTRLCVRATC